MITEIGVSAFYILVKVSEQLLPASWVPDAPTLSEHSLHLSYNCP